MRVAAEARDIELTLVSEDGLRVFGDAELLTTAVANLVDQRRQLQRRRHPGRHRGPPGRGRRRGDRHRPGPGHPRGRAGAHLRALLPGRRRPLARHRRHRPRPGHRQARLRQPRRRGERLEPGGARLDLHDDPSRGGRPAASRSSHDDGRTVAGRRTRREHLHDAHPDRRGRGVVLGPAVLPAQQEGYEVAVAENGHDALTDVRRDRRRPRAARPHAARAVRRRRVPRAAPALERAGHHADRQGQRDRQGRGARARRRRLRHQALLLARAARPDQGRAAPAGRARGAAADHPRGRPGADGRRAPRRHRARRPGVACRSRSSSCSRCCCATPAGC